MAEELSSVDKLVYDTLTLDSILQATPIAVYSEVAQVSSPYPYIVFGNNDTRDKNGMGGVRIFDVIEYYIRICNQDGYEFMTDQIDRIDYLMTNCAPIAVDGIQIGKFMRQRKIREPVDFEGNWHFEVTQIYSSRVYPLPT